MTVSEVRKRYLDFFKARGHAIIPSAPIVPENDPTTLFTSSGMQPLVPYLLGQEHPAGARLADSQTSFRAEDIEEVGDNRHTTFFEMLGNWSLGDYFKQEQLPWFFEFLTSELGLDAKNLYVTVFGGDAESGMKLDTEAVEIWQKLFTEKGIEAKFADIGSEEAGYQRGMQDGERVFAYGAKKNWWSRAGTPAKMPAGEPGGPDSEVFYDFGLPHDTKFGAHCHPNCDCGRFIEIGNSVFMQFIKQGDGTFKELPKKNVDFGGGLERMTAATRGNPDVFLIDVFDAPRKVIEKHALEDWTYDYNDAVKIEYRILLDHTRAASFMLAQGITPSNTEQGYILRRLLRRAILAADRLGIKDSVLADIAESYGATYADQYPLILQNKAFIREEITKEEDQFRKTLTAGLRELDKIVAANGVLSGEDVFKLFTSYGFPVELTTLEIVSRGLKVSDDATDVFKKKFAEHIAQSRAGAAQKFAGGLADHQEQTIKYHTAHHILLAALQKVLGPEVKQRGSNITSERLRIDFSWGAKMTPEQIAETEKIVNEIIEQKLPVTRTVMPKEEAEKLGAQMEFGVKYPEMVSVYSVGPAHATEAQPDIPNAFSLEFCGGPHVSNTSELGSITEPDGSHRKAVFKIQKEEASSAGIRRIKAVLQ